MEKGMQIFLGVCGFVIVIGLIISLGSINNGDSIDSDEWKERVTKNIEARYKSQDVTEVHGNIYKNGNSCTCTGTCYIDGVPHSYGFSFQKNGNSWIVTVGYVHEASLS